MTCKHKVWIEFDHPETDEEAEEICAKANRMVARLGDVQGYKFFWSKTDRLFCWGNDMGYLTLPDFGHWFNLDYLGRE